MPHYPDPFGGLLQQERFAPPAEKAAVAPVQTKTKQTTHRDGAEIQAAAAAGLRGAAQRLPHRDRIQAAFGKHDIRNVDAYVGGEAAAACGTLNAHGYAMGTQVAFATAPDLHTAAHEAAHVVQQRAGVQLKGGVGESGDTYERHADAVADAVVRGESAERLLEHTDTAATTAVQRKEAAKPHQQTIRANKDNALMVMHMKQIAHHYHWLCARQKAGVEQVERDSKKQTPPSLSQALLGAVCEIALAGALGALGKAVEIGIQTRYTNAKNVSNVKVFGKAMAASTQAAAKQLLHNEIKAKYGRPDLFWTSQTLTLLKLGERAQDRFFANEHLLWKDPEGPQQAAALAATLSDVKEKAYGVQYSRTLDAWANMLALKDLGVDSGAEPLMNSQLGDMSNDGVLGLEITLPPATSRNPVTIRSATIKGLKPAHIDDLEKRPLGDIRLTKNIEATQIGLTSGWEDDAIKFAIHPSGKIVWSSISSYAGQWIETYGKITGTGGGIASLRHLVMEDMKNLKPGKISG